MKEKIYFCKYYDDVVNYSYDEDDELSNSLLDSYVSFIYNLNLDIDCADNMIEYDNIMHKYVTDKDFNQYLHRDYENKNTNMEFIVDYKDYLIERYLSFQDFTIETVKSGKWF